MARILIFSFIVRNVKRIITVLVNSISKKEGRKGTLFAPLSRGYFSSSYHLCSPYFPAASITAIGAYSGFVNAMPYRIHTLAVGFIGEASWFESPEDYALG